MLLGEKELQAAYKALLDQNPHIYLRDAANQLRVSEMALLPIAHGEGAIPLRPDFITIFETLPKLGKLLALSRNEWAVIETTGVYPTPMFEGPVGVINSSIIDLRLYLQEWKYAYAVRAFGKDGKPLYSLQFFAPNGEAIHKVYLQDPAFLPSWEGLVEKLRLAEHPVHEYSREDGEKGALKSVEERESFLSEWGRLRDTHDFHALLRRYGLDRFTAMHLAQGRYAWRLPANALEELLQWARESGTPIMFFVGNRGIHHIFTGRIYTLTPARGWINIMDDNFTLHLNPAGLRHLYLVEKPTQEGYIYSIEVFGPAGEEVLWVFGARKPGNPVPEAWLEYIRALKKSVVA
ncbi:MAG: ChuX/HutX family heme-like substrate-binding protein [Bacteroidia bacterium]|nr:hypothetical protein [Bacteroidia bacterium]MDW8134099.1 ChuX/HutX family heme-like substrate-binding protein [Bacteroidia bacterium]